LCSEEVRDEGDVSVFRSLENIDLGSGGDSFVTSVLNGAIYRSVARRTIPLPVSTGRNALDSGPTLMMGGGSKKKSYVNGVMFIGCRIQRNTPHKSCGRHSVWITRLGSNRARVPRCACKVLLPQCAAGQVGIVCYPDVVPALAPSRITVANHLRITKVKQLTAQRTSRFILPNTNFPLAPSGHHM
jgi:hypothetical protein